MGVASERVRATEQLFCSRTYSTRCRSFPRMPPSRPAPPHPYQIRYPPLAHHIRSPPTSSSPPRDTDAWVQWHHVPPTVPRISCIKNHHEFTRNVPDTWVRVLPLSCQRHGRQRQCGARTYSRVRRLVGSDAGDPSRQRLRAGPRVETKLGRGEGRAHRQRGRRDFHSFPPVKLFSRAPIPPTTPTHHPFLPFLSLSRSFSDFRRNLAGSRSQPEGGRTQLAFCRRSKP